MMSTAEVLDLIDAWCLGCTCCASIIGRPKTLAVAELIGNNGNISLLCLACLNLWFDHADEDEALEPACWKWLAPVEAIRDAGPLSADVLHYGREQHV